jgi:DNA polymerase III sliding clamp (beta) subunit (PCNA family)
VVERKNTIPVLSNVLLEAEGDELRLTATDLELQISLPVPAQVAEAGAITVQAALLQSIVREPPRARKSSSRSMSKGKLLLATGRSRYKLQTLPADHFPKLVPAEDAVEFAWPAPAFKEMLAKVSHAQSSDPARYYLNGALLEAHAGALVLAPPTAQPGHASSRGARGLNRNRRHHHSAQGGQRARRSAERCRGRGGAGGQRQTNPRPGR